MGEPTLTEALAARGLTHRPGRHEGRREILRGAEVVFVGDAHEAWMWLAATPAPAGQLDLWSGDRREE